MAMFLMLIICLIAAFSETKGKIESKPIDTKAEEGKNLDGTDELGRAINLQGTTLLADFREGGKHISKDPSGVFLKARDTCLRQFL